MILQRMHQNLPIMEVAKAPVHDESINCKGVTSVMSMSVPDILSPEPRMRHKQLCPPRDIEDCTTETVLVVNQQQKP